MKRLERRPLRTRLFFASKIQTLFSLFLLIGLGTQAQVYTPSVAFTPTNYSSGDTVSMEFSVGDPTHPLEEVSVIEMEYSLTDQIFVDAGMTFDPNGSWFVSATDSYTVDIQILDGGHLLSLKITRNEGKVSGYGMTGDVSGILIDDGLLKNHSSSQYGDLSDRLNILLPDPGEEGSVLKNHQPRSLYALSGQKIRDFPVGQEIDLSGIRPGVYLLRATGGKAIQTRKLIIR